MPPLCWLPGPACPTLGPSDVHVWAADLERPQGDIDHLFEVLSADERERARRFVAGAVRNQFVAARSQLRLLLGRTLGTDPTALRFGHTDTGKPTLAFPTAPVLHFNVSHSGLVALYALSVRGPVGIDVERRRSYPSHLDIARRYFTPAETQVLHSLPPGQAEEGFFRVWTCKEAFLKLTGLGLSHGLDRFDVNARPDEPARMLQMDGQAELAARYSLQALEPAPEYVGALAVEGHDYALRCWSLTGV